MSDSDTTLVPGDDTSSGSGSIDDGSAARIAALEGENAQLKAALSDANTKLQSVQTVAAPLAQIDREARLIGEDWSQKSAAEAKAAGVTKTVLCKDGYYVPGL